LIDSPSPLSLGQGCGHNVLRHIQNPNFILLGASVSLW
jgi:hypothetical protein